MNKKGHLRFLFTKSLSPWPVGGLIAASVALALMIATVGASGPGLQSKNQSKVKAHQIFELIRTNYKPYKKLVYEAMLEESTCHFRDQDPIDVYYVTRDENRARLEMSKSSKEYFSPREIQRIDQNTLSFNFKALREFTLSSPGLWESRKKGHASAPTEGQASRIEVKSGKKDDHCEVKAHFLLHQQSYAIKQIIVQFNLFLGLPVGLDYVKILWEPQASTSDKVARQGTQLLCVYGKCH